MDLNIKFFVIVFIAIFLIALSFGVLAFIFQVHLYIYSWALKLPWPSNRVKVLYHVLIPMRDGVMLMSDIYRPRKGGRFPAVLLRTPYGKGNPEHNYPLIAQIFSSQGYAVIVQDVRGKYGSEGEFQPFVNEERDGRDTIDWISSQDWSNGKCALFGFSYLGNCAWLTAPDSHPALKTILPMYCCQNAYTGWVDKGVPYLKDILFWLSKHHGRRGRAVTHEEVDKIILQLPVLQFDKRLTEGIETFKTWMGHLQVDEYWRTVSVNHRRDKIHIPALFVGGWFDRFLKNTIDDFFETRGANPGSLSEQSRLIIGPWGHQPTLAFPEMRFGVASHFRNQIKTFVKWLNTYLKGEPSPFDQSNPIDYFMMGTNVWKKTATWPPSNVFEDKYYLTSKGNANTCFGDGKLTKNQPAAINMDNYTYDPEDPCPSIGNNMIYGNNTEGPREQAKVCHRQDVLVYTTKPLQRQVSVAGPVLVVIYVSSSALDTDFCAKLTDTYPNGKSYFLLSGFIRMRFLDSVKATNGIEKGKVYRVEIDLGHIAHTFLQGHSITLQITSSDFPNHGRNLNTGGSNEGDSEEVNAYQTIYNGGIYCSYLSLPTLPENPSIHQSSFKRQ